MNASIEVRELSFEYADHVQALDGVSLTIGTGGRVGLIGPNGAGKSTLLLHLNGLFPHLNAGRSEGEVVVDGMKVDTDNLHEVRRRVGLLFQDPNDQLFCPTVFEDVAFGPQQLGLSREQIDERVADALAQVGLQGFENRAPHHLSGGEKKRVCLAAILACEPSILVLDEPSSGLDPKGRRELKALLRNIALTQIIATHDLELVVELCEQVIILDHGRIAAHGPTRELLSDKELMLAHGLEKPHILQHHHPH